MATRILNTVLQFQRRIQTTFIVPSPAMPSSMSIATLIFNHLNFPASQFVTTSLPDVVTIIHHNSSTIINTQQFFNFNLATLPFSYSNIFMDYSAERELFSNSPITRLLWKRRKMFLEPRRSTKYKSLPSALPSRTTHSNFKISTSTLIFLIRSPGVAPNSTANCSAVQSKIAMTTSASLKVVLLPARCAASASSSVAAPSMLQNASATGWWATLRCLASPGHLQCRLCALLVSKLHAVRLCSWNAPFSSSRAPALTRQSPPMPTTPPQVWVVCSPRRVPQTPLRSTSHMRLAPQVWIAASSTGCNSTATLWQSVNCQI